MMRRRTRMQDGLALLKVNVNSLTDVWGGVNLVPSTHAKAGFAEGQSVQDVMWAKDFIAWCFNRFSQRRRCSLFAVFLLEFWVKIGFAEVQPILTWVTKIVQTESKACKLAYKLCRGAAYLGLGGKVMY